MITLTNERNKVDIFPLVRVAKHSSFYVWQNVQYEMSYLPELAQLVEKIRENFGAESDSD